MFQLVSIHRPSRAATPSAGPRAVTCIQTIVSFGYVEHRHRTLLAHALAVTFIGSLARPLCDKLQHSTFNKM
jgi:hypothetical protein